MVRTKEVPCMWSVYDTGTRNLVMMSYRIVVYVTVFDILMSCESECESYILPASLLWDPEFGSILKPSVGTWLQYVMACVCWVQYNAAELVMGVTWINIVFTCWCLHLIFLWVRNSPVYLRCALFWHIKWCRVVIPYWWFGTTYHCHSQGPRSPRRMSVNKLHIFLHCFISYTVRYFCPTEWFFSFLMYIIRNQMTAERQTNHIGKYTECPISLEP